MIKNEMEQLLRASLNLELFEFVDDSAKHAGHQGAVESGGGHYFVLLVSEDFKGKSLVRRQRMIYDALKPLKDKIHALGIKSYTPEEYKLLSP